MERSGTRYRVGGGGASVCICLQQVKSTLQKKRAPNFPWRRHKRTTAASCADNTGQSIAPREKKSLRLKKPPTGALDRKRFKTSLNEDLPSARCPTSTRESEARTASKHRVPPHVCRTRDKASDLQHSYELPVTQIARPLPTSSKQGVKQGPRIVKKRRKNRTANDDAPRAFKRLMAVAQGKKIRSGLDDGEKSKRAPEPALESLRIRPGEDSRSFAARVDAALPLAGLATKTKVKNGKDEVGLKVYRTRKELKMHKLYDQWRAEERKIQDQKEEELEEAAERALENGATGTLSSELMGAMGETSGKTRGRKRRAKAEEEDPWLELKRKRAEAPVGLHDVAQAPPELHKKMRQKLTVGDAAVDVDNIPKAAGSIRRREELQSARNDVVEAYRKIREHEQAKLDASKRRK